MRRPSPRALLQSALAKNVAVAAMAVLCVGARVVPHRETPSPVMRTATAFARTATARPAFVRDSAGGDVATATAANVDASLVSSALASLGASVTRLSHPKALEEAFHSYFAYRDAHGPSTNPYLYFVDYGLPSTTPRGYVFDMAALRVVDGPFMVAHGRGSLAARDGIPHFFSNRFGAATTSLGLYVAQELYDFRGHNGGQTYRSTGLRLAGVSGDFNDNARARGVVAHGAPYVTDVRAGRSEGCPAMAPERASRLLPKLANGGLVFLFAPDAAWMERDPWMHAS